MLILTVIFTLFSSGYGHPLQRSEVVSTSSTPSPLGQNDNQRMQPLAISPPLCGNSLDVVVAIDSSGSVMNTWDEVINDVESLLSNFVIQEQSTRVGIIDFSAVSNVYLPLDSYNTDENVYYMLEVLRTKPQKGETWVELGLDRASEVFRSATPLREKVKKVLVMYTDGESTSGDYDSIKELVKDNRKNDIETFVVTVSNNTDNEGIKAMASSLYHIYHMSEVPHMGQPRLEDAICWDVANSTGKVVATTPSSNNVTTTSTAEIISADSGKGNKTVSTTKLPEVAKTTPSPTKSKCELEKEDAQFLIDSKVPTLVKIYVPECSSDGRYKEIQHHEGTGYYWCVDRETGEVINGTRTLYSIPQCSGNKGKYESKKLTNCETEQEEASLMLALVPDLFVPRCSFYDGLYLQVQDSGMTGYKWCVNRYTGEVINGTLTEPGVGNPVCPEQTKCEKEIEKAFSYNYRNATKPGEVEKFVPQCNPSGLYEKIQVNVSDGTSWCVDVVTGEDVNGTKVEKGEGMPVCPGELNPQCMLPKVVGPCRAEVPRYYFNTETGSCEEFTFGGCNGNGNNYLSLDECVKTCGMLTRCLIDREKATMNQPTANKTLFFPECEEDGAFKIVQRHKNGSSWCVDQENGRMINGTMVDHDDADCSKVSEIKVPEEHEPKCHKETGKQLSGMKGFPPIGMYIAQCTADGFYEQIQHYIKTGESWCVHKYTGEEIEGTRKNQGGDEAVCPEHSNMDCLLPKDKGTCEALFPRYYYNWQKKKCIRFNFGGCAGNNNNFRNLKECERICKDEGQSNDTAEQETEKVPVNETETKAGTVKQPVEPLPEPLPEPEPKLKPSTEYDMYHPSNPCSIELDYANQRNMATPILGAFVPQCDEKGDYKPLQSHGSSGIKWCVDIKTGHEIKGTRMGAGYPDPDCDNASKSNGTATIISTLTTISPRIETVKLHVDPYPEPEPEPQLKPTTEVDIYHPENPCSVEVDFAKQRKMANPATIGDFMPQCDETGKYKPLQSHGSTGTRWCVDINTGHEINGTRAGPGLPEPDCSKAKTLPKITTIQTTIAPPSIAPPPLIPPPPTPTAATTTTPTTQTTTTTPPPSTTTTATTKTTPTTMIDIIATVKPPVAMPQTSKESKESSSSTKQNKKNASNSMTSDQLQQEAKELGELANNCPYDIGTNLTKIGCYNDDQQIPRPLPVQLVKDTSINVQDPSDKDEWKEFINALVCKCAIETRKKGWYTFAIQNYGACYSGPDEGRYDEDREAKEDMCINEEQETCQKSDKQACAGISREDKASGKTLFANYVFMIKTDTHKEIHRIEYDKKKRKRSIHKKKKRRPKSER